MKPRHFTYNDFLALIQFDPGMLDCSQHLPETTHFLTGSGFGEVILDGGPRMVLPTEAQLAKWTVFEVMPLFFPEGRAEEMERWIRFRMARLCWDWYRLPDGHELSSDLRVVHYPPGTPFHGKPEVLATVKWVGDTPERGAEAFLLVYLEAWRAFSRLPSPLN